jgi:hypothetical protein
VTWMSAVAKGDEVDKIIDVAIERIRARQIPVLLTLQEWGMVIEMLEEGAHTGFMIEKIQEQLRA